MQNNINQFCEEKELVPDFWTIEEIKNAMYYIKDNYMDTEAKEELKMPLRILKKKLNYKEY